jgi:transcriptional regulator with XRE-family HTH domain
MKQKDRAETTLPQSQVIDYDLLAQKIAQKREKEKLGLREAAEQCGISFSTLNRLERNTAKPDVATLNRILAWLDISVSFILMGKEPIRAHLRAHPDLDSATARSLAEAAIAAQNEYSKQRAKESVENPDQNRTYKPLSSGKREFFAEQFRTATKTDVDQALDPFRLSIKGVSHMFLDHVPGIRDGSLDFLTTTAGSFWSAITIPLTADESEWLIILNPTHSIQRQRATLMEEVCHILLGHNLTKISHIEGQSFRNYDKEQESDAYALGAAILVPRKPLVERVKKGQFAEEIAAHFGVSKELVEYRIKVTGAWYIYKLHRDVKTHHTVN